MQKRSFYSSIASLALITIKSSLSLVTRILTYIDLTDVFVLSGISMIFYGTYVVYPPAAYVITGGLLIWVGMRGINSNPG